ncbi:DUF6049 family protein [Streptomyces calidiresistens]|uniref:Uncharacterized protein n=1 Tax=Streptomyces calidiresistens TaxID=1485586 RepID=A0A7W3T3J6_9ACTN|nr:DUF6049 family protein [Streptomyces calidiresistens]MBB0230143.1 hypothetical protein [Streptomyces calidiresistens]
MGVAEPAGTASREPSNGRWSPRGLLTALILTLLLVPLPGGAILLSAGPAAAEETPDGAPAVDDADIGAARVTVTEVSPAVPRPNSFITLRGTVTNTGDSTITTAEAAPRLAVPLTDRAAIDAAADRQGFDVGRDGSFLSGHGVDLEPIEPEQARPFTIRLPVSELGIGTAGVHQVTVAVTGRTEAEQWDQILGAGRTLLPVSDPADRGDPEEDGGTAVTVLWPLISTSHLLPGSRNGDEQIPVLRDDTLLTEISSGGRLHDMVTLGADLPVTWVIDPDLLASVDAMTDEYRVRGPDGTVEGQGQEVARAWLHRLREAVADAEVVALPYADPDLASLAHQGKSVPGALAQLRAATELAPVTVETILGVTPRTDFAWPVEGAVDPDIVSVATSAGAQRIITRDDSVRTGTEGDHTPSAAGPIGGGVTAVVADTRLSALADGRMSRAGEVTAARQSLLAHTMVVADQTPAAERHMVLAPQRMPTTAQARALAAAVDTLADGADWARFAELDETARAEPDPLAALSVPGTDEYPERLREQEQPTGSFEAMRETHRALEDFAVILTRADRVVTPFGNAIRREMSTSWRGEPVDAARYRAEVRAELRELTEQVHLIEKSPITLSGRNAIIPVTVQNNLMQEVQGLELRLTSSRRIGLEVDEAREVAVGGGHSQSVKFEATARANGRTVLEAQLYTADGKPYGEAMRFHARVTSITSAVMLVIAGGVLLVVLAGIRMYTQRKRAEGAAGTPGGEPDGPGDAPGPGTGTDGNSATREPGAGRDGDTGADPADDAGGKSPTGTAGDPATDTPAGESDTDTAGGATASVRRGETVERGR